MQRLALWVALAAVIGCDEGRRVPAGNPGPSGVVRRDATASDGDVARLDGAALDDAAVPGADGGGPDDGDTRIDASAPGPDRDGGSTTERDGGSTTERDGGSSIDSGAIADGGATGRDASTSDGGRPSVDAGIGPAAAFGSVILSASDYVASGTPIRFTGLSAGFNLMAGGPPSGCMPQTHGSCTSYRCPASNPPPAPPTEAGVVSATVNGRTLTTSFSAAMGYYQPQTVMERLFFGGESVTLAATGGRVAAFNTQLSAPSLVTLSSPALGPPSATFVIPRAGDINASWTGGAPGETIISLSGSGGPSGSTNIQCVFRAGAVNGVIPASAIATLPNDGTTFSISAASATRAQIRAGDADVYLQIYLTATTPNGDTANRAASY